jgi:ATP-dependent exoDNAse (exonuclease V) alpha subunit
VITNRVEEMISHNIFYTAITRVRKFLKIYWTSETDRKAASNLKHVNCKKDAQILANKKI